jgi:hypothetical protein
MNFAPTALGHLSCYDTASRATDVGWNATRVNSPTRRRSRKPQSTRIWRPLATVPNENLEELPGKKRRLRSGGGFAAAKKRIVTIITIITPNRRETASRAAEP